ncbi:hypothetical protein F0Q53_03210 [Anaplasma marginale]|uniref:Uncharacterized protein n=2 Tax=Anaplasma marginale TaxID=770 RepID=B9KGL2_ANAMF|nr:hypothetical protein AM955 [Anaplasma marginale str. St. Maries]ACM49566.1 Hypothetical protein AMF_1056 [Anaplasma marginale str. Florida]KAA8474209.1 hypothetical protein F0Q53_03210 [Anaplasma marginale]KAB0451746.1 hypothetical protein FY207_03220 [Anaplasma marginale]
MKPAGNAHMLRQNHTLHTASQQVSGVAQTSGRKRLTIGSAVGWLHSRGFRTELICMAQIAAKLSAQNTSQKFSCDLNIPGCRQTNIHNKNSRVISTFPAADKPIYIYSRQIAPHSPIALGFMPNVLWYSHRW